jgi:hypothetical protein
LELKTNLEEIFEIASGLEGLQEGFDMEGDEDLLKMNFGGRNVDIKRSVLTKPQFGWNLFSCLFQKRWDGYHVRDKKGRIYVDMKEEWMRPLLDYMKYGPSCGGSCLNASNRSLVHIMRFFAMDTIFRLRTSDHSDTVMDGMRDVSKISGLRDVRDGEYDFMTDIYDVCHDRDEALRFDFKLLYSRNSREKKIAPFPKNVDFRFKSFLILIESLAHWEYAYVYSVPQTIEEDEMRESSFCDFFPLQFVDSQKVTREIHLKTERQPFYERFEIYEFRSNYERIEIKLLTENRPEETEGVDSQSTDGSRASEDSDSFIGSNHDASEHEDGDSFIGSNHDDDEVEDSTFPPAPMTVHQR